MHSYQHNIKTFNHATRHLTRVERSLYRDLIELYYDTEQPLPGADFDRLARLVLAHSEEEKAALKVVLSEFFTLTGTVYSHDYCDEQIEKFHNQTTAKAKAGKASALARQAKADARKQQRGSKNEQVLNPVPTEGQQNPTNKKPETNNQKPNTPSPEAQEDERLARWMYQRITDVMPEAKQPIFEKWSNTVRLMRERDNLAHRDIAEVFDWANRDSFWKTNILSPDKLREKFPQLSAKRREEHAGSNRITGQSRSERNDQAAREYLAELDAEVDSGGGLDSVVQQASCH